MKKIFFGLLICGMFCPGLSAQTKPDDSGVWIIAGGGTKGSRVIILADENSIKPVKIGTRDAFDVAIRFVVEQPDAYTGLLSGNARVYCDKGTIAASNLVMSNKGKVSEMSDIPEQKPEDEGDRQIIKFVCNRGKDERQRVYPPTEDALKTGFIYIGQKETGMEAEFLVRNALWDPEGYIEKLKAEVKSQQQILDFVKAQYEHLQSVATTAKNMKAKMEDEARRAQERRSGPRTRSIQNLIGLDEADVVKLLGDPYSFNDDGKGNRWLYYYEYKDTRQMMYQQTSQWSGQFPVGELLECGVTFLITNGKVYDYTVNENADGACADLGF